jgi:hypothetical protein
MMRSFQLAGALGGVGVLSLGCAAQVGTEYTGDVLLELHGHVVAPPDAPNDLVPALAFTHVTHFADDVSGGSEWSAELIDGKVEGVFPSNFKLSITETPPAGAHEVRLGYVVLVPRDHPRSLELATGYSGSDSEVGADGSFTEHRGACTSSGRCAEADYSCTIEPCEVIYSAGDPGHPEGDISYDDNACGGRVCYQEVSHCRDDASCFRQVLRCDLSAPGSRFEARDQVARCSKTGESGDATVGALTDYAQVVSNLIVSYATTEQPSGVRAPGLEVVRAGYQLTRLTAAESEQSFIDDASCRFAARVQALAEVNEASGTHYVYGDAGLDQNALDRRFLELVAEKCPYIEVIDKPAEAQIELILGRQLPTP